jgi:hypothetical protein
LADLVRSNQWPDQETFQDKVALMQLSLQAAGLQLRVGRFHFGIHIRDIAHWHCNGTSAGKYPSLFQENEQDLHLLEGTVPQMHKCNCHFRHGTQIDQQVSQEFSPVSRCSQRTNSIRRLLAQSLALVERQKWKKAKTWLTRTSRDPLSAGRLWQVLKPAESWRLVAICTGRHVRCMINMIDIDIVGGFGQSGWVILLATSLREGHCKEDADKEKPLHCHLKSIAGRRERDKSLHDEILVFILAPCEGGRVRTNFSQTPGKKNPPLVFSAPVFFFRGRRPAGPARSLRRAVALRRALGAP